MQTDEWAQLSLQTAEKFTPSAPIDAVDLFAGRWTQLTAIKDAVITKGQHAIVFGERGVGKTSLVSVVGPILVAHKAPVAAVLRENCGKHDSFASVWKRALAQVTLTVERKPIGFSSTTVKDMKTLAARVSDRPGPDEIVTLLRHINDRIIFVFDEFDQMPDIGSTKPFADTIKALSDYNTSSKIVIAGVGDDIASLLEAHASVDRALIQIPVPRMASEELLEIITKVADQLGVQFETDASQRIVEFSQGLPHYVHLLGLHSTRDALSRRSKTVTVNNVEKGVAVAVSKVPQSTLDAYANAVDSPQKDALFRHVLLACALTPMDERGTFAPGDIRDALKSIGRELEIPAYAAHLNKFASVDRGHVLDKIGRQRRFRYRFRNPLMQPYVVLRGLADSLVTLRQVQSAKQASRK